MTPSAHDPEHFAEYGFLIHPEQGDLIYLLCQAMNATCMVDFSTSVRMSALYFAAAIRHNGGEPVICAELAAAKAETARRNLYGAGLDTWADNRTGDARETLQDVGGRVDLR